jgi:uncharacterized membrane protein YagU involved in acid resistance
MSIISWDQTANRSLTKAAAAGAIAGLGGGLIFGILMGMMGMLPMIGMLVGQQNAVVGFIVHMVISALIGGVFGAIASRLTSGWGVTAGAGVVYGFAWWVLGALILMPLFLGMTQMVLVVGGPQWMSLMGHMIYGLVTALLFVPLSRRL